MEPRWYERAVEQLEADYAAGLIDYGTFDNEMRELNNDLRSAVEDAAEDAYRDAIGGW